MSRQFKLLDHEGIGAWEPGRSDRARAPCARSLNGSGSEALRPAGWLPGSQNGALRCRSTADPETGYCSSNGKHGPRLSALRPMTDRPTVFIIDDDAAVRETLAMHVGRARLACQTFASAEAFLGELDHEGPGCVVVDVMLPGMNGLDLLKTLRQRDAGFPVILLTGYADVDLVVTAFRTGASDFLVKPVTGFKLIEVVQSAIAHSTERFRAHARAREVEARLQELTPRERDILPLLITGATAKQIARTLSISHRTVEHYRHRVLSKFHARSVLELAEALKS